MQQRPERLHGGRLAPALSLALGQEQPVAGVAAEADQLRYADVRMDVRSREVWRGERPLRLTRTEFGILEVFLRHPRQVLTRSALFEQVWGYDFGETSNSIHVYLGYLRRKLEAEGESRLLWTVRGVGFVLRMQ